MPGTNRRHSTPSEDTSTPPLTRQLSQDGTEIIPTRMSKVTAPKPASNPLQFIKTGPCDLYKAAQEQIKKVEEIKKVEKVKDDSEDWQSNLDNWKCCRRKRQEHIIERVVEVKKLELEEHDRNRRRSKTFNEMMEERNSKGGLRKMSILSFSEDLSNDLSDLGLSSSKDKSSGDFSNDQVQNGSSDCLTNCTDGSGSNSSNGQTSANYDAELPVSTLISSPEAEEYTYERAIQGYMNFAETKVRSPMKSLSEKKGVNGSVNFKICSMKKEPSGKIGEKLSELEQIRLRSKSTNDISGNETKQVPKVDVHKRRSLFENADAIDTVNSAKASDRLSKDLPHSKSIKERVSNLEKNNENITKCNRLSGEMSPHIKETISTLEKQSFVDNSWEKRLSNGNVSPQIVVKERLNVLEKHTENEGVTNSPTSPEAICPMPIKERMSSFDSGSNKRDTMKPSSERDAAFIEKLETFKLTEKKQNEIVNSIVENNSNICSDSVQDVIRPLDRLEVKEEESKSLPGCENLQEEPFSQSRSDNSGATAKAETAQPVSLHEEAIIQYNKLIEMPAEDETVNVVPGNDINPNKEVEGFDKRVQVIMSTEGFRTRSSQTDLSNIPDFRQLSSSEEAICMQKNVFEDAMPRPLVNISVSIESVSKDSPKSENEEELDEFPENVQFGRSRDLITLGQPSKRVRKLTPILTSPKIPQIPLKTVCELQIIEESENGDAPEEETHGRKSIAVHMSPGRGNCDICHNDSELQMNVVSNGKEDFADDLQEESAMYTDENIDEVLGKDDDFETTVNDEPQFAANELNLQNELKIFTPTKNSDFIIPLKPEIAEKQPPVCGNYENVLIAGQVSDFSLASNMGIYAPLGFPLGARPSVEPPKEKPPPPPSDLSDDESNKLELPPKPSLRRLDSTKRIKKEIRKKRSDFLGIEGANDDSYLEPDIYVAPPPDMMTFLQEERRLEQQLYRQSICSESDSNHETAESRDSGVELDRGHADDICWSKPDVLSEPHSRQNSETFGNTSITSEEDEILKKEREIIEVLEKEEQWRYGNKNSHGAEQNDIGEKLAVKLRQLEHEKMQLERERAEEEDRRKVEESARRQNEQRLIVKQQQLREQENSSPVSNADSALEQEALRFERERLQQQQEHLNRCRQNFLKEKHSEFVEDPHQDVGSHWDTPSNRHSLQEVPFGVPLLDVPRHSMQDVSQPQYKSQMSSGYRYSLPDLQQRDANARHTRPPPPVPPAPPAKPMRPMTQEQWERETNIRNSRAPSADNIPLQIEASTKLRHGSSVPAINANHGSQQMTRSTLQALSAAPRSRIISNENWMQPRRKVDATKSNYNYQHWLIQEAEHRRILEHQQKVSQQLQSKRILPYNGQSQTAYVNSPPSHHTVGLPISPSLQPQSNQKWVSPPRPDKPLPDSVIHTLTQRAHSRESKTSPKRRLESSGTPLPRKMSPSSAENLPPFNAPSGQTHERMLSVSGKKKCSHCNEELGRGAAMIIESLRLFYHIECFKCCVCHVQLGDGLMGTDVRVRNNKLHCHNCYSSDDGVKFSCV